MFSNNFEFKVQNVTRDKNGNFIVISFTAMEEEFLLVNVYGPNRDSPIFYDDLYDVVKSYKNEFVIAVGDWNLVLDPEKDYDNYIHINNPKAKEALTKMMDGIPMTDIWREMNPECKRFTWRKSNPLKQSRLDFFLMSEYLIGWFEDTDIVPGYRTDHSMVTLTLKFGKEVRHKSLWKYNVSLLKDDKYISEINKEIMDVIKEYAWEGYDEEALENISHSDVKLSVSDKVFLDFLLMKIRSKTIAFASMKKRKNNEKETFLINEIKEMEENENKTEIDVEFLKEKNQELALLREKKMTGVLIRSRARWIAEGEKTSKYFCNLEKRHYVNKRMVKLHDSDGQILKEQKDIIKEVRSFYKKLYTERCLENKSVEELIHQIPKLSEDEATSLEGQITLMEAALALKNMKNGKSPGTDGFSSEFFKFFWRQLGPFVVRALNESYRDGELSSTQKEGLITCIPKGNKPKEYIKNWRPISLLNVVYKIGSSCIANRVKMVLPSLISEDQTGFIKGRYIGDNIRLIYDLIHYLDNKNIPGMLLCLDFEKAFDSLDWRFMLKVMRAFGFKEGVCRWIETFYKNIKSAVMVNGQISDWFVVERGCRQGDPISPYLFVLSVEILAIMIRESEDIKGIAINEEEHKISQFADDTALMNTGDFKSFDVSMQIIDKFGKSSGLFINAEKTEVVWLGSMKNSQVTYYPHLKIVWNPKLFKILGIWFGHDLIASTERNYRDKFTEVKRLFQSWLQRSITPVGRIAVLKSLILSKLIHLWILLPDPPDKLIADLQTECFKFVWKGKPDRISRKIITKNVKSGGLNVPNIKKYMLSLKLMWLRKLKFTAHKWKNVCFEMFPFLKNVQCYGSLYPILNANGNRFWTHVFKAYFQLSASISPKTQKDILSEPVFYNDRMKVGGRVIKHIGWIKKGVYCVAHFLNSTGKFYGIIEFNRKYGIQVDFLTYASVVSTIRQYINAMDIHINDNVPMEEPVTMKKLCSIKKGSKAYYDVLTHEDISPNCCRKWDEKLNTAISWKSVFFKIHKIQDVKLKWFQMRIVHRIVATNIVLIEMKVKNSYMCNFCTNERDSIEHVFWECNVARTFWTGIETLVNDKCAHAFNFRLSQKLVLFGVDDQIKTDTILDLILLLAKHFLYSCKMNSRVPRQTDFISHVLTRFKIEEYNAKMLFDMNTFNINWIHYKPLFENVS